MAQISRLVRTAIYDHLSDVTNGFNAQHAVASADAGVAPIQIDWSEGSRNFLYGRVAADAIEETDSLSYPVVTIDTISSRNENRVITSIFSGTVLAIVEMHISFESDQLRNDFATIPDTIEEAMYRTFNLEATLNTWPAGIVYNANVQLNKGPILMAGDNWRQTLTFNCSFRVITN